MTPKVEPLLPPVEAYRWFVLYGTCAFTVIAESKLDALVLTRARLGRQVIRSKASKSLRMEPYDSWEQWRATYDYFPNAEVVVRRLSEADLDLIEQWNDVPELVAAVRRATGSE